MPTKRLSPEEARFISNAQRAGIPVNQPAAAAPAVPPAEMPAAPRDDSMIAPEMAKPDVGSMHTLTRDDIAPGGITDKDIAEANVILRKYKAGKVNLERRVIACEQWWKLRHWDYMEEYGNEYDSKPASAWLFNCIMSKHADGIDAYPEPNIRPREPGDKDEARKLTSIVPVVLEQNGFEETYSQQLWQKLKQGTGIYGIFWDKDKLNGLGDIAIRKIDVLNIYWEPGITDIQRSRHIFTTEYVDIDILKETYADRIGDKNITGRAMSPSKYVYDDNVDLNGKAMVIDWYYHKNQNGRSVLHYVKFVDDVVLYATENEEGMRDTGLYAHGLYPFVFDPLFPIEGSPCGHGYVDVCKNAQGTIDKLNQAIEKNALMAANKRFFVRTGGSVNENEFADWSKPFVHVSGNLDDESIREISVDTLPSIYMSIMQDKVNELKETSGNRDANNGGTSSGVTAASAIAAMQEQAGKSSKASTKSAYRAYGRLITMVIELIRQFYDMPRQYRIIGENGTEEFVSYDSSGIQPQSQGSALGVDMGYRLPVFDIVVSAQKLTSYTKVTQNELALQLFQMGVLEPQNSDKALALLDMMDFAHKDLIEDKVRKNGTMFQTLAMYQQLCLQLAMKLGDSEVVEQISQNIQGVQQQLGGGGGKAAKLPAANDPISGDMREPKHMEKARARSQQSSQPG